MRLLVGRLKILRQQTVISTFMQIGATLDEELLLKFVMLITRRGYNGIKILLTNRWAYSWEGLQSAFYCIFTKYERTTKKYEMDDTKLRKDDSKLRKDDEKVQKDDKRYENGQTFLFL